MAKQKKDQLSKVEIPAGEHAVIPLLTILPDPNQPRKHFDEVKLKELAESIKSIGVTQNIIVHQNDADGYTLIAGERRYRASILAGKEDIPAIIYPPLPEDVVKEIQIAENLHRQDMNAMEESDAFFDLTKRGMTTAADIAKRINKSEGYVYDRLALQNCIEHVQEMLRNGSLPITHGKQFAKLNINDQQELWDNIIEEGAEVALSDLKDKIRNQFSMVLDNAPFDLEDASLVAKAGACKKCPKRSGCNGLLFDDVSSKDICFDKTCYDSKVAAHIAEVEKKLRAEGKTVHRITAQYSNNDTPSGTLSFPHYNVCEEEGEFDAYGIVISTGYKTGNVSVGTVVCINYTASGRVFLGLPIGEQSDSDGDEGPKLKASAVDDTQSIDHDGAFTRRLQEKIIKRFELNPISLIDFKDFSVKQLADEMDRIHQDNITFICSLLDIDLVPADEDGSGEFDFVKTAQKLYDKTEFGYDHYIALFSILNSTEQTYWQHLDIAGIKSDFPSLFFDVSDEMIAYETETGHKFPQ